MLVVYKGETVDDFIRVGSLNRERRGEKQENNLISSNFSLIKRAKGGNKRFL